MTDKKKEPSNEKEAKELLIQINEGAEKVAELVSKVKAFPDLHKDWIPISNNYFHKGFISLKKAVKKLKTALDLKYWDVSEDKLAVYYKSNPGNLIYCLINDESMIKNKKNLFLCTNDLKTTESAISWESVNSIDLPRGDGETSKKLSQFLQTSFPSELTIN